MIMILHGFAYIYSFVVVLSHMVDNTHATPAKYKLFTSFRKLQCGLCMVLLSTVTKWLAMLCW